MMLNETNFMRSTVVQKCQAEMVAIFAEKVMAEQAEIV
ncbi:hypothetical protein FB99_19320 [Pantoea agglomerans]|nr:hypothetical protein FB99_19320 [Pantoea agglomerans]